MLLGARERICDWVVELDIAGLDQEGVDSK